MQVCVCVCVCVCVHDYGGYKKIGFHVVGICRPLSKFIVPLLRRMWMASMILLFQYPHTLACTLAPSQLMACWDILLGMAVLTSSY